MGWVEKQTMDGQEYYYNSTNKAVTWDKPDELRSAEEIEEESGEWFWVPHKTNLWQPARLSKKKKDGSTELKNREGDVIIVPKNGKMNGPLTQGKEKLVPLWPVKSSSLRMLEDDLVMLDNVNEALIAHNIRERYMKNQLYTWVGAGRSVLVSVNPYKSLPLYGKEQVDLHRNKPPNRPLTPHVYDIANDSYDSMMFESRPQSILISGESGAGKTVCTKQCLDFLAQITQSENNVEGKIISANPLLEAFGNANTIRNNNSSRFGKWIEIHFDTAKRAIVGAKITQYLLEKSRVVQQAKDERNYHIFYQLTSDKQMQKKYSLGDAKDFHYLNQSGCYKANGINDKQEFSDVQAAMDTLGFSSEDQAWVFSTVAGVLHLGNVTFKASKEKGGVEGSKPKDAKPIKLAAGFFGCSAKDLEKVLCYRSISVKKGGGKKKTETNTIPLNPNAARIGCDSLAKGIYSRLFDYLVMRVNASLKGEEGQVIGVLDIFGFEIFDNNSFEQLNINYANEKLQQQFNRTTFKEEEALYMSEGIDFKHIEFIDNQPVLDLIEARPYGILLMLDDEGLVPEGSDDKFMNRLEERYASNDKFQTDTHRKLESSLAFEIDHYAGVVKYNSVGWMEKNKDTLFGDMQKMMGGSKTALTAGLFPMDNGTAAIKSMSYHFRGQLTTLMDALIKTDSRYIRCVKPNSEQVADKFNTVMCVDQLRYSGVFEAIEIRKTGYPFRYTYSQFACRYSCINPHHKYSAHKGDFKAICEELLQANPQTFNDMQFGNTMVLYRTSEHKTLELLRNLALEEMIPRAQRAMRGHLAREMRRRLLKAEKGMKKALKVGNDFEMLKKAIEAVPGIIGTMEILFDYQPRNISKAKHHLEQLQKWKDLEAEFEGLVTQDADEVYYKLKECCDKAEELSAEKIPTTKRQQELVDKAENMRQNSKRGKIDAQAKIALEVIFPAKMREASEQAAELNHTSDDLAEINKLLALSDIDLVQMEIDKAKAMGDDKRRIHREIRYKELLLENSTAAHKNLSKAPMVRNAEEWGKNKKKAAGMLLWQSSAISAALTKLPGGPDSDKQAAMAFKAIMAYMGDKSNPQPQQEAATVLQMGVTDPAMRDEIFVQLMKQLTANRYVVPGKADSKEAKRTESLGRGWELMGVAMSIFPPSEELELFLMQFIKDNVPGGEFSKYFSAMHGVQYGGVSSVPSGSAISQIASEFSELKRSRYSVRGAEPTGPTEE